MTGEVSPAGSDGGPVAAGLLRASHEDRDAIVEQLRTAAGDGRLTADELDGRLELALTARTYGELAALTADLPAAGAGVLAVPGGPVAKPRDLARIQIGSGQTKRDGRWAVPQRIEVGVASGRVKLDFTEAMITGRTLRIDADVRSGTLLLVTRPGIVVDADDVTVRSGRVRARLPWGPNVPEILRIEVTGSVRSGSIIARPPRRNLWQWLRREPRPYKSALE